MWLYEYQSDNILSKNVIAERLEGSAPVGRRARQHSNP